MKKFVLFILLFIAFPVFAVERININTASLTELDKLTGIGPKYAQAIIDARPFSSVDDLDRVKGIGPATLAKIKTQGFACVNCANSVVVTNTTPEKIALAEAITSPSEPQKAILYPTGIEIHEILPNPEGADETEEWIKLYNQNNFEVDLSGWKVEDTNGTPKIYTLPKDSKILANGFLTLKRIDTKIMLNNDADGINLLTPDEKIIDSVNFTKAPLGQTYKKTMLGWAWSGSSKALPKTKKTDNNIVKAGVADISQIVNQDETKATNPWFLFYIVLAVTIISASIILFIKLKLQKNVRT